jgi:hypothetical protein
MENLENFVHEVVAHHTNRSVCSSQQWRNITPEFSVGNV